MVLRFALDSKVLNPFWAGYEDRFLFSDFLFDSYLLPFDLFAFAGVVGMDGFDEHKRENKNNNDDKLRSEWDKS